MIKLKELLALLETGWFRVIDRDTGLRTETLPTIDNGNSQLRTLRDKTVKCVRLHGGALVEIEVATE